MMITVVLSSNMLRMMRDHVLVRKLVGIETSGSLNILFTDKTGTLTRGRLQVTHFYTAQGKAYDSIRKLKQAPALCRLVEDTMQAAQPYSTDRLKTLAAENETAARELLEEPK